MAHLVYKAPLVNEKARERYIQTRRDLDSAKTRGEIDAASYKIAKKNLAVSVSSLSSPSSPEFIRQLSIGGELGDGYFDLVSGRDELQRTSSQASTTGSESASTGGESASGSGSFVGQRGLVRSRTGSSGNTESLSSKAATRRGTIFDRNNVGRLVFKSNAQSETERARIKGEAKSRAQLKRLIQAYEISQKSPAGHTFSGDAESDERAPTPAPAPDAEYDPRLGAHTDAFYSTRPLPPINTPSTLTETRKRNFSFFRWNAGSNREKTADSSPTNLSPQATVNFEAMNALEITPRTSLDLAIGPLNVIEGRPPSFALRRLAAGINAPEAAESTPSLYSTAPSSLNHVGTSISTDSTPEGAILSMRTSNDTLRSYSFSAAISPPRSSSGKISFSGMDMNRERSGRHGNSTQRTLADYILGGAAAEPPSSTLYAARGTNSVADDYSITAYGGRHLASRDSYYRPTTSGSSIKGSLGRRRHSFSSDRSFPAQSRRSVESQRSAARPRTVVSSRLGGGAQGSQIPRREMFVFPFLQGNNRRRKSTESLDVGARMPGSDDGVAEGRWGEYVFVETEDVGSSVLEPSSAPDHKTSDDCSALVPPSSVLLDAFCSLLEEYSLAPRLFSFPRSDEKRRKGTGPRPSQSRPSTSNSKHMHSSTPNIDGSVEEDTSHSDSSTSTTPGDIQDGANLTYSTHRRALESTVWFLSAWKWLSCGRLLFSPIHHLLAMSNPEEYLPNTFPIHHDTTILDLDTPATGGWSWHMAYDYPSAIIYNVTTSESDVEAYRTKHMQPLNHRLVLTESLTSLKPLEDAFFDVITARTLPGKLRREEWAILLKECHRVLKPGGYIELTIVNPVLTNMGPITKAWISDNVLKKMLMGDAAGEGAAYDIVPSESVLGWLREAGWGEEVFRCQVWMPAGSIGDEFSEVTSRVGRYFYDELFATWGGNGKKDGDLEGGAGGSTGHVDLEVWQLEEVKRECVERNTMFQWLRCHARKAD